MEHLEIIRDFIEGRLSLQEFCTKLYNDEDLQETLSEDVSILPYTKKGSLFEYVVGQDCSSLAAAVNVRDALSKFLHGKGVDHKADSSASETFRLILAASPSWLMLPDIYVEKLRVIIRDIPEKKSKADTIKKHISEDFRFVGKPPKWLQSANWPFQEKRPMIFVGQLNLGDLLHDTAQIYVFFDELERKVHSILQQT